MSQYVSLYDNRLKELPEVSIVVPCYQAQLEISQLTNTIAAQKDVSSYEVIFCDDASTDKTVDTLIEYISTFKLPALLLVRNKNGGVSLARNHCLAESRGRFVCFLDHDDTWHPNKLSETLKVHAKSDTALLTFHSEYAVFVDGSRLPLSYVKDEYEATNSPHIHLYRTNFISTSTVCIPGDLARKTLFRPEFKNAQDYDYWLRASQQVELRYIEQFLGEYHYRTGSLSDDQQRSLQDRRRVLMTNILKAARVHGRKAIFNALKQIVESFYDRESRP